jgi:hypothetical protein
MTSLPSKGIFGDPSTPTTSYPQATKAPATRRPSFSTTAAPMAAHERLREAQNPFFDFLRKGAVHAFSVPDLAPRSSAKVARR